MKLNAHILLMALSCAAQKSTFNFRAPVVHRPADGRDYSVRINDQGQVEVHVQVDAVDVAKHNSLVSEYEAQLRDIPLRLKRIALELNDPNLREARKAPLVEEQTKLTAEFEELKAVELPPSPVFTPEVYTFECSVEAVYEEFVRVIAEEARESKAVATSKPKGGK